jgi:hypothetical protein
MGSKNSVLAITYKTYVRPVLENGTEVFVTAPANALATLDRIQNQALRAEVHNLQPANDFYAARGGFSKYSCY